MRTGADLTRFGAGPVAGRVIKAAVVGSWLATLLPAMSFADRCSVQVHGTSAERSFAELIELDAGCEYLIEARQLNADVVLAVLDPEQRVIVRVDSPMERVGLERAVFSTRQAGAYTVRSEPRSAQGSWGQIEWRLSAVATAQRPALQLVTRAGELYATATQPARIEAAASYRQSLDSWRSAGSRQDIARTQLELGWLEYTWMENWEEAARLAEQVRAIASAQSDPLLHTSATMLGALARLESAQTAKPADQAETFKQVIASLAAARRGFEQAGLRYEAIFAQNSLGLAHHYAGDSEGAVRIFTECVTRFSALRESTRVAMARQNIGWVQIESGDYTSARDHLHAALQEMQSVEDDALRLAILNNYALVQSTLGEYDEAIRTYLQAHDTAVQVGEQSEQARALHGLGVTYLRAGNEERAVRYFRQALPMRPSGRGRIATLLALGNLLRDRGEVAAALSLHEEARRMASLPLDVARTYVALGNDRVVQGSLPDALSAFEAALAADVPGTEIAGMAEIGCARVLIALGQLQDSLPAVSRGIEIHERNRSLVHAAEAYGLRASLHRLLSRAESAKQDIDTAIRLGERGRSRLSSPDLRTTYLAARADILEEKLQQLTAGAASSEVAIESLLAMERWRAAGLRDRVAAPSQAASHERRRLQDALIGASYQLEQAREKRRPDPRQIVAIDARIAALETALDSLEGPAAAAYRDVGGGYDRASLLRLQAKLGKESVVAYYSGDGLSWRWVITRGDVSVERLPALARLRELLSAALPCYATPGSRGTSGNCVRAIRQLSSVLLPRHALPPDGHAVTFIPDGLLSAVPFAALYGPQQQGRYVIDTHEVAVSPALSLLGERAKAERKERTLMIVADPVYAPDDVRLSGSVSGASTLDSLPRLPATAEEAAIVAAAWRGRTVTLQGLDARRDRVLDGFVDRFDVLHFATHVTLNRANADLSRIELSRYDRQGRVVSAAIGPRDFRDHELSADLVVLSGCESALGVATGGEGMLGFQQSLLGAGARNVIATLWSVSDRSSLALMKDAYRQLAAPQSSYRRTLRDAQLRLRKSTDQSAPYYWAAFALYSTCLRC